MCAQDITTLLLSTASQADRLVKLDTTQGRDVLLPLRVTGHSRIGRGCSFIVDVVSLNGAIELKSLMATAATLWLQQDNHEYRPIHGLIHTIRRLGADGQLTYYQLIMSSWMHFLRFRKDARIFQEKTTDSILREVFAAHPQAAGAYRFNVQKPGQLRSFCMQYEDDFNFVHRLLESEGWFYTVEQAQDGKSHTLVITDDLYTVKALDPRPVEFYRSSVTSETDALVQWASSRELQSSTYSFSTVDYKSPQVPKNQSIPTKPDQGSLTDQAEVYEYGGAYTYADSGRGDDISRFRMEEWESRAKRFYGTGSVRRMDAGRWFEFENYPEYQNDADITRQFAVIETRWFIENNLPLGNSRPFPFRVSLSRSVPLTRGRTTPTARSRSRRHRERAAARGSFSSKSRPSDGPFHIAARLITKNRFFLRKRRPLSDRPGRRSIPTA
jgi:type VI secretion system secreted protein VgrG